MKKSMYRRLMDVMRRRDSHVSKSKRFAHLASNPAGSKFRKWCNPLSNRGADGTLR